MPLPLYGSGGRTSRISAAVWPTTCLSVPLTTIWVGTGTSKLTPGRGWIVTGVRVPDRQLEVRSSELRAVADPLDLEVLLEPLRHALDHVRDERPREAVQRAVVSAVGRPRHVQHPVFLCNLDAGGDALLELAERAGDLDVAAR